MEVRLGPNETEAHLRPDFGRVAVSEVGMESANLRKSRGFQRLDRGSGEFEKVHWRKGWDSNPRWAFTHGGFQDRCLKPLGHPSNALLLRPGRGARQLRGCWRTPGPQKKTLPAMARFASRRGGERPIVAYTASFERSARLRSLGSRWVLRRRMDFGVTSTRSSSSI